MSARNDGGPAFPWGEHGAHLGGMSLREYFAAQAMQMKFGSPGTHIDLADMAAKCFAMADAMLAESIKTDGPALSRNAILEEAKSAVWAASVQSTNTNHLASAIEALKD